MKSQSLFLLSIVSLSAALFGFSSGAFAQPAVDRISSIDGNSGFVGDEQKRYFNRANCGVDEGAGGEGGSGGDIGTGGAGGAGGVGGAGGATAAIARKKDPSEVDFEVRLQQTGSLQEVWLWIGKDGAECEKLEQRDATLNQCAEVAGNPQRVDADFTLTGLVLQDLLEPETAGGPVASCEISGLAGTRYQLFVFRGAPADTVDPANYGIAELFIDIENPDPPSVNTDEQLQSTFTVRWGTPSPTDEIQSWELWYSTPDDLTPVKSNSSSTLPDERELSITAQALGLSVGESATLYAKAYDKAFVSDPFGGNQSELSDGVPVTFTEVLGYCDLSGNCGGCSVSPLGLTDEAPGSLTLVLGFLLATICAWRFRR